MKQKKIPLIAGLVKQLYPSLEVPDYVQDLRPFYEGVIAHHQCRGNRTNGLRNRINITYVEGSDHHKDWELGWQTASEQKPVQLPTSFPFQQRVKERVAA